VSVLDNAKAHFDKLETKVIEVEEWDTVIYATPFTMGEKKKLWKHAKEDDIEFMVRTLLLKALNKDGEKMFDLSDKITLMNHVDPNVIVRIVGDISVADTIEEMSGN
tara:strand:+ start:2299 stop:2619 length:321 start_codon:yes stop_codon:yes gene_type:complete